MKWMFRQSIDRNSQVKAPKHFDQLLKVFFSMVKVILVDFLLRDVSNENIQYIEVRPVLLNEQIPIDLDLQVLVLQWWRSHREHLWASFDNDSHDNEISDRVHSITRRRMSVTRDISHTLSILIDYVDRQMHWISMPSMPFVDYQRSSMYYLELH